MTEPSGRGQVLVEVSESSSVPAERMLSTFERVLTTNAPILESLVLQIPTETIFNLYHTSRYLRKFLQHYPLAWRYLSFRLSHPSANTGPRIAIDGDDSPRQSHAYSLDQLLMHVVTPLSPLLKSLEVDNTLVSGQVLISTVLHSRRHTLEHLSVRGCKNVSLKYHIIPYLTMFGLQYDLDMQKNIGSSMHTERLVLKSLYTYRCRHHRRRPYLATSLARKDSDSEPTHELVILCHKLGIWTDTAWCTTPAGRCYRRRGYVTMRIPQGNPEVYVVFDRLWRSKNWIGPADQTGRPVRRDGRLWEHDETGYNGEALGVGEGRELGEGKKVPTHLRRSHTRFVDNIHCDGCGKPISERCEQCSILMHCVGCRKTFCSEECAFDRPFNPVIPDDEGRPQQTLWWAPRALISPCFMHDPPSNPAAIQGVNLFGPAQLFQYPSLKLHWCCTEPIFSGGGGISIGTANREVDQVRAAPLPRGMGWEHREYAPDEWSKSFPKYAYGDPKNPDYSLETGHLAMMKWLLGPPDRPVSAAPRNLCQDCYDCPQWKVHCKSCSKPLCIEHDLRGLRLRICGYRDLALEKIAIHTPRFVPNGPLHVHEDSRPRFDLPYRPQLPVDSAASSVTEEQPADDDMNTPGSSGPSNQANPALPARRASQTFSVTNSNHSRSSSPSSVYFDSSSYDTPKWQGCQSFFCPQYRAVGDQRQRCASVLRECSMCSVYVCQDCVAANPPCNCSYCAVNYHCPNCLKVRERDGSCLRVKEEKAKPEAKSDLAIDQVGPEEPAEHNGGNDTDSAGHST